MLCKDTDAFQLHCEQVEHNDDFAFHCEKVIVSENGDVVDKIPFNP